MRTLTFNRVVGVGAMGTVYHGELRVPGGFSRSCAVKLIKRGGPEHDRVVTRMRDEARLLGMLEDESILGVSELVRLEGFDAVLMEYVDGADLWETSRLAPLPPRALAELAADVSATLHRAHTAKHPRTKKALGVIHRDVKPANVMVTNRGGVRLLDFGVARAAFEARESETLDLVLGTLHYFPPEVLAGGEPSRAVDIYGLGLSLWECATGREWGKPVLSRGKFEARVARRMEQLDESYAPLIPVLVKMMAYQAVERPSAAQLERQFLALVDGLSGQGLRAWARETVPRVQRGRGPVSQDDTFVGRTVPIDASGPDEEPTVLADPTGDVELDTPYEQLPTRREPAAKEEPAHEPGASVEALPTWVYLTVGGTIVVLLGWGGCATLFMLLVILGAL